MAAGRAARPGVAGDGRHAARRARRPRRPAVGAARPQAPDRAPNQPACRGRRRQRRRSCAGRSDHRRARLMDLAIYDMDRTVTRRATYTPFLIHCALRRAPWRLVFLPLVIGSMLLYVFKLIDRAKLKEINHELLLGRTIHPTDLKPLVESFADSTLSGNIRPGARRAIARD